MTDGQFGAIYFGSAGLLFFAGFMLYARHLDRRAAAASAWPTVVGKVVRAGLKRPLAWTMSLWGSMIVAPDIAYTYEVDGQSYRGTRIQFGAWPGGRMKAESFVSQHGGGAEVAVLYNPEKPQDSVLRPTASGRGIRRGAWIVLVMSGLYAAMAWWVSTHAPPPT